ncbi:MAG: hypothetical protein WBP41_09510 [Saprospiraceae bacterium]
MEDFEEKLNRMTKPAVVELRHGELLGAALIKAKDKLAVSWWWIIIPIYMIAIMMMKGYFNPGLGPINIIDEFQSAHPVVSITMFLFVPLIFIWINFVSIKKVYLLSGSPSLIHLRKLIWQHLLIILFSILVSLTYMINLIL